MPFANLPDVRIHYEFAGAEHLPVLVLSNCLGTNLTLWDSQIEAFSRHFQFFGTTPGVSANRMLLPDRTRSDN